MPTIAPTPLHRVASPVQLSLVGEGTASAAAHADPQDGIAWQIGFDHARHGLPLPTAHLHTGSPLFAGWQAALARRLNRHRDPTAATRRWLGLRLQAWTEGLSYDEQLLTPHYLQQLDATHCPVTRAELHDEQGHAQQRCLVRLRQDAGYAAGHLAVLGATAAQALAGRTLPMLQALALQAARLGEPLDGLDAAAWARLVSLVAYVTPGAAGEGALRVLPPNRLRLAQSLHALQAWMARQLASPGWSQRLLALHDALPGVAARQAATALSAALAPHAVRLPLDGLAQRWALEDLWLDARVQRRWAQFAALVSPLTAERLLRELPAPSGWVVEQHCGLMAA